jgi:hypothetical protein
MSQHWSCLILIFEANHMFVVPVVDETLLGFREAVSSKDLQVDCIWTYPCQSEPCPPETHCVEHGFDQFRCLCQTGRNCSASGTPGGLLPSVSVHGPVRVRDLVVDEGGRTLVTTDNIDLLVDYRDYGFRQGRLLAETLSSVVKATKMAQFLWGGGGGGHDVGLEMGI